MEPDRPRPIYELSSDEMRELRQTSRKRWSVPDELKTQAMVTLARMVGPKSGGTPRDRIAALKVLAEIDGIDQKDRALDLEYNRFEYETAPLDRPEDDYVIDLSDPPQLGLPAPETDDEPEPPPPA